MHPREFGRYRILKLLPKGGMGVVYLAIDSTNNQQVALKLIELGPDRDRQEIAAAEKRGATLQEALCSHDKRITQIRHFGELENFFYIEMEYVEGHDLSEVLRDGPLGTPFAARIGSDLCEVLHLAHTFTAAIDGKQYRGVVHGDIKPRNVRITPLGEVRVLDFGIAKALSLTRSFTQIQFGSSQYSSPERLLTGEVNVASDLWAVAVLLYETVTGRPYFEAETGEKTEALVRNYREVRPLPPNLPKSFAAVLRKALNPVPELRYQTAASFGAELKLYLQGKSSLAETTTPTEDSDRTRRSVPLTRVEDDAATRRTMTALPAARSGANRAK
ncbi:MAG: serine/threonine protein kinase, partial [Bryobacteraceae bacterium]|nr:serine/threonine protein kinase [Bryobacteraceae bacterium]